MELEGVGHLACCHSYQLNKRRTRKGLPAQGHTELGSTNLSSSPTPPKRLSEPYMHPHAPAQGGLGSGPSPVYSNTQESSFPTSRPKVACLLEPHPPQPGPQLPG